MHEDEKKLTHAAADVISKAWTDKGLLIEGGFAVFHAMAIPKDAALEQLRDLRWAFFAGAQHLWGTMINMMDPGTEPTDEDMRRMSLIAAEFEKFFAEVSLRASGRAS